MTLSALTPTKASTETVFQVQLWEGICDEWLDYMSFNTHDEAADFVERQTCGSFRIKPASTETKPLNEREIGEVWLQPIQEILDEWYSVEGDFDEVLPQKLEEAGWLFEQLETFGWTVPVVCVIPDDYPISPMGYRLHPVYGNGHHRLAVAIELGLTHIPVCRAESYMGYNEVGYVDNGEVLHNWHWPLADLKQDA